MTVQNIVLPVTRGLASSDRPRSSREMRFKMMLSRWQNGGVSCGLMRFRNRVCRISRAVRKIKGRGAKMSSVVTLNLAMISKRENIFMKGNISGCIELPVSYGHDLVSLFAMRN